MTAAAAVSTHASMRSITEHSTHDTNKQLGSSPAVSETLTTAPRPSTPSSKKAHRGDIRRVSCQVLVSHMLMTTV
jgi:hypothetical protein